MDINESSINDEVDLRELIAVLWNKRFFISLLSTVLIIISIGISLFIPNYYTSSTLLSPKNQGDSLSDKLSNLSSIASFGGIDLPGENTSVSDEAIARVTSYDFYTEHFLPNIKLQDLMAVKKWSRKENIIIYDSNKYDDSQKLWVRKVDYPKQTIPTTQESYLHYKNILNVSEDKRTSFVNISITHKSANIAKEWVEIVVNQINEDMRNKDRFKAEKSIEFLKDYAKSTNIEPLQDAIANLLEIEMKSLMLTSINDEYVYEVIDNPYIAEKESSPNRILIVVLVALCSFLSLSTFVLLRHFLFKKD